MAADTELYASQLPERQQALGICLAKLTPDQRGLLHAHYTEGRPLREIAQCHPPFGKRREDEPCSASATRSPIASNSNSGSSHA